MKKHTQIRLNQFHSSDRHRCAGPRTERREGQRWGLLPNQREEPNKDVNDVVFLFRVLSAFCFSFFLFWWVKYLISCPDIGNWLRPVVGQPHRWCFCLFSKYYIYIYIDSRGRGEGAKQLNLQ